MNKKIGFLSNGIWNRLTDEAKIEIVEEIFQGKTMNVPNHGGTFETVTVGDFLKIDKGDSYEHYVFEDKLDMNPIYFQKDGVIKEWNQKAIEKMNNKFKKIILLIYYHMFVKKMETVSGKNSYNPKIKNSGAIFAGIFLLIQTGH